MKIHISAYISVNKGQYELTFFLIWCIIFKYQKVKYEQNDD